MAHNIVSLYMRPELVAKLDAVGGTLGMNRSALVSRIVEERLWLRPLAEETKPSVGEEKHNGPTRQREAGC